MKLSDLRPCDNCGGKIAPFFYVVRYSICVLNQDRVRENLGLAQCFHGHLGLAEVMSPAPDVGRPAMDQSEHQELETELFVCHDCYVQDLNLALLAEKRAAASKEPTA